MALKADYKDDIFSGARKYMQVNNADNTKSFLDVTEYSQEGDYFGANEVNEIATEINRLEVEKADKADIPTSLPANGGDADTVDGKHASDFANANHSHNKADIGLGNVDNTADANKNVNYANGAGNADTVDGLHVDGTLGNQSLKPIIASTNDLTAGVSPLSQGTVYIVYE